MKAPKLTTQIFLGMAVGVAFGHFLGAKAAHFSLFSDIFLRLIKMIIAPLVFSTLVVGIAKLGDVRSLGRIGIKTFLYFQVATAVALISGITLVNFLHPGTRMHINLPKHGTEIGIDAKKHASAKDFVTHVIPTSIFESMATNEILQIVVFSLFFGACLPSIGEKSKVIINGLDALSHLMFGITRAVMSFAPFGVFGALAAVVGEHGIGILAGYLYLVACFFGGLLTFIFVGLGLLCTVLRIPFFKLLSFIKEPILLAFSTASSEVALPKVIERMERFGCSDRITSFVLPLGYSFNLDGSIMYMTFATMFIAQAYGIHFSLSQEIIMMLMMMVTSKGMAGVPRASLIVIAGALTTFNIPLEGLAIILGVDQILDMGRSATNVVGNAVATAVVSKWEGELNVTTESADAD
ncbi:dicarboxylate/amino acid:cation symporter [bacterium]|nr:dicarboxylate/amino acid:cation symporter [bacterium]